MCTACLLDAAGMYSTTTPTSTTTSTTTTTTSATITSTTTTTTSNNNNYIHYTNKSNYWCVCVFLCPERRHLDETEVRDVDGPLVGLAYIYIYEFVYIYV